jgi:hypothetical protein
VITAILRLGQSKIQNKIDADSFERISLAVIVLTEADDLLRFENID